MKRCLTPLLLALALALAGTAHAQGVARTFPKEALRGELTVKLPPYAEMDDRNVRLSPGARILDTGNRSLRSASLLNQTLTVNYLLDRRGQVSQAWILTDEEKKEKRPGFGVTRNYTFESQQGGNGMPAATGTPATSATPAN